MNVKRYTGRNAREALALVKQALGEDAVVLSTKPCAEGVEVLAMAPESMAQIEQMSARSGEPAPGGAARPRSAAGRTAAATPAPARQAPAAHPAQDAETLEMSTLSFQDYVRNRMLKRRQAALREEAAAAPQPNREPAFEPPVDPVVAPFQPPARDRAVAGAAHAPAPGMAHGLSQAQAQRQLELAERMALRETLQSGAAQRALLADDDRAALAADLRASGVLTAPPVLHEEFPQPATGRQPLRAVSPPPFSLADAGVGGSSEASMPSRRDHEDVLRELRSVRGLIEDRFSALAFMEKLQKNPKQATLTQRLLDCGFSPALVRKLADGLTPAVGDELAWACGVLERNLDCGESTPALEDQGGVLALVGPTGVGKTTSTAKLAAAFATRHGAGNLGLITLDAYRMGAHEQLRAYGRILGVSVHTAHDRASLEDLLELLSAKKMVIIDTAGMGQRDSRTGELLDMVGHPSIRKLLVLNAAAQGETTEDVMHAYRASQACGVVLSKVDEAVKLAPALDALIRHRVKVMAVANGQRVPEDWHRLSAAALVQRAIKSLGSGAYRHDNQDVNLVFTALPAAPLHAVAPKASVAARHAGEAPRN